MALPPNKSGFSRLKLGLLCAVPIATALGVWFSALSFVPVPWPDDSAFYFVAKELFQWPPRWVMLPQAPFEPTYEIFNFNTMPLYPLLIGLGRWLGIDGSFALKLWPLGAWAATGVLLTGALYRAGLPAIGCLLIALAFSLDPALRWSAVLVRPESLIAAIGMAIVMGMTFGFPHRFRERELWHPISALLALGAYAHFNAIHLLFPVVIGLTFKSWNPRQLVKIGSLTALYLLPWILTALLQLRIFIRQMSTQWARLAVDNPWLDSPKVALKELFQEMGSPEPWSESLQWAGIALWAWIGLAALLILVAGGRAGWRAFDRWRGKFALPPDTRERISLLPAAGWVLGAVWLWDSKPEVWFTHYLHVSIWALAGVSLLRLWQAWSRGKRDLRPNRWALAGGTGALALILPCLVLFAQANLDQVRKLSQGTSWNWNTYHEFVACVDDQLTELEARMGKPAPFRVWCPTFPDITIELSRRHPHWQLTRTNDFHERADLALQHGRDVEAVVVTEILRKEERTISGPAWKYPEIRSVWMTWKDYFLHHLWYEPGWKPYRLICQRGRWQAFIFAEPVDLRSQ